MFKQTNYKTALASLTKLTFSGIFLPTGFYFSSPNFTSFTFLPQLSSSYLLLSHPGFYFGPTFSQLANLLSFSFWLSLHCSTLVYFSLAPYARLNWQLSVSFKRTLNHHHRIVLYIVEMYNLSVKY